MKREQLNARKRHESIGTNAGVVGDAIDCLHGKRVLLVVNVDWFFLSHRLPIARAARDAGAEVGVASADTGRAEEIRREGLQFYPLPFSRKGIGPLGEMRTLTSLAMLYRRVRPDLVHHVTIKPILYGSLAARLFPEMALVNAVSGLGFAFAAEQETGFLRRLVDRLYGLSLRRPRSRTIFQNPDDQALFVDSGSINPRQAVLIRGSGVDCMQFRATPLPDGDPVVVLPARMLWDKGVAEFVEVARRLRLEFPSTRFALVGSPDEGNPRTVPLVQLQEWADQGVVEWWGYRTDMPEVLRSATVVVLPSRYPEGVPKVLIEAAASARPIVTTDAPGCREIVRHRENGILIPPGDTEALAGTVAELLRSPELRRRFGAAGRRIAESEFAEELVVRHTMEVYAELLQGGA